MSQLQIMLNNQLVKKPLHKNCTSTCFVYFLELFIQNFVPYNFAWPSSKVVFSFPCVYPCCFFTKCQNYNCHCFFNFLTMKPLNIKQLDCEESISNFYFLTFWYFEIKILVFIFIPRFVSLFALSLLIIPTVFVIRMFQKNQYKTFEMIFIALICWIECIGHSCFTEK
jgi:hypothetical protein